MPVFPKLLDVDETTGRGAVTFQILPDRPPLTAPPAGCRLPGAAQLADQTHRATLFDSFDAKSCVLALARLSPGSYGMTIGPPPAQCNRRYGRCAATTTPYGEPVFHIFTALAQLERRLIRNSRMPV